MYYLALPTSGWRWLSRWPFWAAYHSSNQSFSNNIHNLCCFRTHNFENDKKIYWKSNLTADRPMPVYRHSALDWRRGLASANTTKQRALTWASDHQYFKMVSGWKWNHYNVVKDLFCRRANWSFIWCRRYHVGAKLGVAWSGLTLHSPVRWERAPSLLQAQQYATHTFLFCFAIQHADKLLENRQYTHLLWLL